MKNSVNYISALGSIVRDFLDVTDLKMDFYYTHDLYTQITYLVLKLTIFGNTHFLLCIIFVRFYQLNISFF